MKLLYKKYTRIFLWELTFADIIQVFVCLAHIPSPTNEYSARPPQRVAQTHTFDSWCDGVSWKISLQK